MPDINKTKFMFKNIQTWNILNVRLYTYFFKMQQISMYTCRIINNKNEDVITNAKIRMDDGNIQPWAPHSLSCWFLSLDYKHRKKTKQEVFNDPHVHKHQNVVQFGWQLATFYYIKD